MEIDIDLNVNAEDMNEDVINLMKALIKGI